MYLSCQFADFENIKADDLNLRIWVFSIQFVSIFLHSFHFFFSIIMRTRLPNCIIQASQLLELALLCLLIPWFEGHSWVFRGFHSIPVVWKLNEEKNSVTSFTFYMRLWILIKYSVYKDVFCLGDFIISQLMARFKSKSKLTLNQCSGLQGKQSSLFDRWGLF